jgi:hypothetical protein
VNSLIARVYVNQSESVVVWKPSISLSSPYQNISEKSPKNRAFNFLYTAFLGRAISENIGFSFIAEISFVKIFTVLINVLNKATL